MKSQKDLTSLIVNPGFETGDYTGWSWSGRTDGWLDVNQDGDASKEGGFIGGYWSGTIADVECTQTIKGLENGYYLEQLLLQFRPEASQINVCLQTIIRLFT